MVCDFRSHGANVVNYFALYICYRSLSDLLQQRTPTGSLFPNTRVWSCLKHNYALGRSFSPHLSMMFVEFGFSLPGASLCTMPRHVYPRAKIMNRHNTTVLKISRARQYIDVCELGVRPRSGREYPLYFLRPTFSAVGDTRMVSSSSGTAIQRTRSRRFLFALLG